MINKHIFEKITGLKPNNDILNILNNPPYNQNSQNNIKLSLSTISKITNLAEMVSNHETSFFRDLEVYQIIKDMILRNSMKIWSAGCSYGQEAYSLAMLSENISKQQNFRIYASDISKSAVMKAIKGQYSVYRKDEQKRIKIFLPFFSKKLKKNNQNNLQIIIPNKIKDKINFFQHNLLTSPPLKELDLIMCRNVLIYMNKEARELVFKNLELAIKPMGWLVMGGADPKPPKPWKMFSINNSIFWQYQNE